MLSRWLVLCGETITAAALYQVGTTYVCIQVVHSTYIVYVVACVSRRSERHEHISNVMTN